ncbi:MAG TPA: hypothetical protein VEY14_03590 [Nocardioidaceae bacterium]|jgi:hypothetical protein|nr:hypothetical protein [Nocardioidaceae bacterium]
MELLFVLIIVAGVFLIMRNTQRQSLTSAAGRRSINSTADAEQMEALRRTLDEDITVLGEELQRLDIDVAGVALDEGARSDYQRALDAYEAAKDSAERLRVPEDSRHVVEILDDGRYAIACVRARVAGQPLPTRRPACFFDPRHGQSVTDVTWAPPGGTPRDVPACALDAERVRAGADPATRQVMVGPQRMPYYSAGPAFAPMAMGYFGSFGLMQGLFMGTMMGSMFGGFGGGFDGGAEAGGFDSGDGGGFDGGGDWGGGSAEAGGGFDFGGFDF